MTGSYWNNTSLAMGGLGVGEAVSTWTGVPSSYSAAAVFIVVSLVFYTVHLFRYGAD